MIIVGSPFYNFIGNFELWSPNRKAAGTEQIKPRCQNDICSADMPLPGKGGNFIGRKATINVRLVFLSEMTNMWSTDGTWIRSIPLQGFRTTAHDFDCFLESNGEVFILSGGGL